MALSVGSGGAVDSALAAGEGFSEGTGSAGALLLGLPSASLGAGSTTTQPVRTTAAGQDHRS
ncbi:hypothetical protein AAC768_06765 [Arthrobacter sp. A333]|uniref:Uncharacterized protein n=1 Tax=Arthrobacter nanjingensis TaxID=1387716 RepID=A0ABU9KIZ2_9MICC|nr:hypothetical protein [Arthrobacter sp. YJM1]